MAVKTVVAPKPIVPMDQASKDARFVRQMEADKSLHDAGRLAHYVEIQQANPNAKFGNADLKRFYNQTIAAQQPKVTTTPTAPTMPTSTPIDQSSVNSIYDAQKNAQLQALYASRDKAIGQLNQQKVETGQQYQGERNQADVVSAQNVQRLRELMASQGLSGSGENITANVGLQNARQSALNGLNLQEQQTVNDYNRQISDLNNPANEQALVAAIEAQRSQALYDNAWKNKNFDYQVGQDAIANQQWNTTRNDNLAQQSKDNAWRQYQYTHMSATDKAQLAQNASQFGEDKAWQMFQLKYNGELQKATNAAQIAALTP